MCVPPVPSAVRMLIQDKGRRRVYFQPMLPEVFPIVLFWGQFGINRKGPEGSGNRSPGVPATSGTTPVKQGPRGSIPHLVQWPQCSRSWECPFRGERIKISCHSSALSQALPSVCPANTLEVGGDPAIQQVGRAGRCSIPPHSHGPLGGVIVHRS